MSEGALKGRRVALGVSGGIAAYKALECLRLLTQARADVRVIMTPEATHFVGPLTFEALCYHPVACDWLAPRGAGETHIELSAWAEVLAIVPATANTLAKLALGLADEILSGTALAMTAPLVLAPAMNDRMFLHEQTQAHMRALRERGAVFVMPATGRLASGETGVGRLAAAGRIADVITAVLTQRRNLDGIRVVVTAGGTREPIDPVRYVGNFSSGKMGRALAEVAAARGAQVTLVTTVPSDAEGYEQIAVSTGTEMLAALTAAVPAADILVMAAAVADYVPAAMASAKIRRTDGPLNLALSPNVDVLRSVGPRSGLFRVGFAAETEELKTRAQRKLEAKALDMIVANTVGLPDRGLGSDFNAVTILTKNGDPIEVPRLPKGAVAERIWDAIVESRDHR